MADKWADLGAALGQDTSRGSKHRGTYAHAINKALLAVGGSEDVFDGLRALVADHHDAVSALEDIVRALEQQLSLAVVENPCPIPTCCYETGDWCGDDPCLCGETVMHLCGGCGNEVSVDPEDHDTNCPKREPLRRIVEEMGRARMAIDAPGGEGE